MVIITHTTCFIFLKFKKKNNIRLNLTTNELIGSVLNQACAGVDARERECVCERVSVQERQPKDTFSQSWCDRVTSVTSYVLN